MTVLFLLLFLEATEQSISFCSLLEKLLENFFESYLTYTEIKINVFSNFIFRVKQTRINDGAECKICGNI